MPRTVENSESGKKSIISTLKRLLTVLRPREGRTRREASKNTLLSRFGEKKKKKLYKFHNILVRSRCPAGEF